MAQTITDLWNGNLAPYEHCGSQDTEANHLIALMERNSNALLEGLTASQKETFQKYVDCSEEYLIRMLELAFCNGFSLGCKLTSEALI